MAAVVRDEDGWRDRVNFMRDAMGFFIGRPRSASPTRRPRTSSTYLNQMFGDHFDAAEIAGRCCRDYQDTVRPFSDEALKIVYVEYETPGPNRMPWSAHPDKDGTFWIPVLWPRQQDRRSSIPTTGEITEYPVPNQGTAAIHSAVPAPDGSVWLTEQGSDKLGKWDPATQKITEYPGRRGKHTVTGRAQRHGVVDRRHDACSIPKTESSLTFRKCRPPMASRSTRTATPGSPSCAPMARIGMVDAKTLKVTKYQPPTETGFPRRIQVDDQGMVWFAEFQAGKIGQFDPKAERFKEFTLPGPKPTPYALGIDADHKVWYSSEWMDVVGRLDPDTGKVIEYPFPHAENTMRDFFRDDKGRMWFGSPANDRVGYFYMADKYSCLTGERLAPPSSPRTRGP